VIRPAQNPFAPEPSTRKWGAADELAHHQLPFSPVVYNSLAKPARMRSLCLKTPAESVS